jgi:2-keto-4-pentenoate hydratase/2-oxohepta-3-ene-1,7-dioic acid hydratase in catechol pathway
MLVDLKRGEGEDTMRIVRFKREPNELPIWGWMADERIGVLDGSPFDEFQREEARLPIEEVQLVAPVVPGKIICIGLNYAAHAAEHDVEVPDLPLLFLKPPSAVVGSGQPILLPPQSQQVEHEAELAVIISQRGRWIRPEQVANYVLGFTAANDVTARDLQFRDGQWTRSKGFDTFCPLGPWIETEFEPADALITCSVNGQMRQMASTRDMIFTVPHIVAFISSVMTLEAGDVILTGTPPGVGPLSDGDEVTVEIEGLGTLRNSVKVDLRGK